MASRSAIPTQNDSTFPPEPHEHRLRNLMGIQVRNFTPFPVRDAVTSSLAMMTGPPPLGSVDDIELALNRRRSRRISTNSLGAVRSIRTSVDLNPSDSQLAQLLDVSPGRPRTNSRAPRISHPSTYQQRPQRDRASSSSSSLQTLSKFATLRLPGPSSLQDASPPMSPTMASPETDQLQKPLEHIMASRLVETFLSLEPWIEDEFARAPPMLNTTNLLTHVDSSRADASSSRIQPQSPSSRVTSPRSPIAREKASPKFAAMSLKQSSRPTSPANPRSPKSKQSPVTRTLSPRAKPLDMHHTMSNSHSLPTPAPSPPPDPTLEHVPFYISPFHRPSTNPTFASLDVTHDFAPWIDLSNHRFKASLWGRGGEWGKLDEPDPKGKSSMREPDLESSQRAPNSDWTILASWDVNMDDMKPLSSDFTTQSSLLPSNTLVVRLAPSGDYYYLPGGQSVPTTVAKSGESRPPSPSAGYSDTEVDDRTLRRAKRRASLTLKTDILNKSVRETKMKKSAGFGDLLNLVTLQSAIADTKVQLEEIIEACDRLIAGNTLSHLQREISQKQENLRSMGEDRQNMVNLADNLQSRLSERKASLRQRREFLENARALHEHEKDSLTALKEKVDEERLRHTTLRNNLQAVRTTLLQTVSTIFPIEPIEPKDLLFGILKLPLPIPTGANNPAPPATLSSDSSYNDETMASALGYVAQVVSLITGYLGDFPAYPVVCQGSRSLIKDPVSAMMGPRMFPLYMRGVDTYRFEYGVFLLNKDIELLMAERDLRALDIRHTLPNLMNLLLTLTSGEAAVLKPRPRKKASTLSHSASIMTELTFTNADLPRSRDPSPSPAPSEQESEGSSTQIEPTLPTTPTASKIVINPEEVVVDAKLSTNTDGGQTARKSFYSPLASFLRARYPSVRTPSAGTSTPPLLNVKVEVETPSEHSAPPVNGVSEDASTSVDDAGDADETSTIRESIRSRFGLLHKQGTDGEPTETK